MTHRAILPLDLRQMPVTLGNQTVTMIGHLVDVDVEYEFRAGLPATDEAPAEPNSFTVLHVLLNRTLAMHDGADMMSLIVSPRTDVLPYLSQLQVSWIEENLPVPEGV